MRVLILSDANSIHTFRWVEGLSKKNFEIGLWSLRVPTDQDYSNLDNVTVFSADLEQARINISTKLKYVSAIIGLNKVIKEFKPKIIHAHFASSYGLLGRLSGFHPFIISVWGTDVFDFPKKNIFFKRILKNNLKFADVVLSTSHIMARETSKYTDKNIIVTPFGIDLKRFTKIPGSNNPNFFTIGTVKSLEEKYGINYLIQSFFLFQQKVKSANVKLLIVGSGSLENHLKETVKKLGIAHLCEFTGKVPYDKVPFFHNQMDVCLCLSIDDSESFGVAAIEASACGNPVIVSNVGGLPEVIKDGATGIVIPPKNSEAAALAIEKLYFDEGFRRRLGVKGRKRVQDKYDWEENIKQMEKIYLTTLSRFNNL